MASPISVIALRPRSTAALVLVSLAGLLAFGWPLFATADSRLGPERRRSPRLRPAAAAADGGGAGRDQRGRPRRQGGGHARRALGGGRRAAPAGRRHRRPGDGLLPARPGRAGVRPRLRLRPGVDDLVRLGPDHRWGRTVAALPDAGRRLGRSRRRAAATGPRSLGAGAARGLRRGRRAALRRRAQLLVLAVRERARERPVVRRRSRPVGQPAPVRRVLPGDVAVVGPRPGPDQRRPHRRHRSGRPRDAAPRLPPRGLRRRGALRRPRHGRPTEKRRAPTRSRRTRHTLQG